MTFSDDAKGFLRGVLSALADEIGKPVAEPEKPTQAQQNGSEGEYDFVLLKVSPRQAESIRAIYAASHLGRVRLIRSKDDPGLWSLANQTYRNAPKV